MILLLVLLNVERHIVNFEFTGCSKYNIHTMTTITEKDRPGHWRVQSHEANVDLFLNFTGNLLRKWFFFKCIIYLIPHLPKSIVWQRHKLTDEQTNKKIVSKKLNMRNWLETSWGWIAYHLYFYISVVMLLILIFDQNYLW